MVQLSSECACVAGLVRLVGNTVWTIPVKVSGVRDFFRVSHKWTHGTTPSTYCTPPRCQFLVIYIGTNPNISTFNRMGRIYPCRGYKVRASASKSGDAATLKTDVARRDETDVARWGEIARGCMLGASAANVGDKATSNNNNNNKATSNNNNIAVFRRINSH